MAEARPKWRRAALRTLPFAFALLVPAGAAADPTDRWSSEIAEASARFGIPKEWIRRVMCAESGGRPGIGGRTIVSPAGAIGLMQLMPATWREMRHRLALGPDPSDPHDNVLAGTAYLRLMFDRFGYPGLFAAYNAGPGRYAANVAGGRPLPAETRVYVALLTDQSRPIRPPAQAPRLFALVRPTDQRPPPLSPTGAAGLFIRL